MDQKLKDMRKESKTLTPNIIIGKNGFTDQVLKNIKEELSKHKLVKLKILQSYISERDKNVVFAEIVEKSGAKVVHKIGFTITLTKR
ncbi:MAG: YhbY family RNA-binding protein [Candidatus Woesearchaeota archaeon]